MAEARFDFDSQNISHEKKIAYQKRILEVESFLSEQKENALERKRASAEEAKKRLIARYEQQLKKEELPRRVYKKQSVHGKDTWLNEWGKVAIAAHQQNIKKYQMEEIRSWKRQNRRRDMEKKRSDNFKKKKDHEQKVLTGTATTAASC
eukprot:Seg2186.2 transcript_id=Seg2186.2/GoldUCD/mRNA.D3Y31 product="hypothetical protein" protein_id=Seg2186.2/GoldUCD/D3Y31